MMILEHEWHEIYAKLEEQKRLKELKGNLEESIKYVGDSKADFEKHGNNVKNLFTDEGKEKELQM